MENEKRVRRNLSRREEANEKNEGKTRTDEEVQQNSKKKKEIEESKKNKKWRGKRIYTEEKEASTVKKQK